MSTLIREPATPPATVEIGSGDRLATTLFFAALLHGLVILGIGFSGEPVRMPSALNSKLEVTLIKGQSGETPDDPQYLAQIDQTGSGNTEEMRRPRGAMQSQSVVENEGIPDANDVLSELAASEENPDPNTPEDLPSPSSEQILTQTADDRREMDSSPQTSAADRSQSTRVARLILQSADNLDLSAENTPEALTTAKQPRVKRIAVNTKSNVYAPYLYYWRLKIEEVGNLNFPDEVLRQGLHGDVTVEVSIKQDGSLEQARVVVPSPHRLLDDAALRILYLAAPFAPFSEEMRAEADTVRFVWKWRFLPGDDGTPRGTGKVYADS
ncbi:MAG: TonB family protein [Pseudomonadota bacterium]|nr:TonB family protein [Pseudomonadota bacterium]